MCYWHRVYPSSAWCGTLAGFVYALVISAFIVDLHSLLFYLGTCTDDITKSFIVMFAAASRVADVPGLVYFANLVRSPESTPFLLSVHVMLFAAALAFTAVQFVFHLQDVMDTSLSDGPECAFSEAAILTGSGLYLLAWAVVGSLAFCCFLHVPSSTSFCSD